MKIKVGWSYYTRVHKWLKRYFGKANKCENNENQVLDFACSKKSSVFHWALKRGCEYKEARENFWSLCVSCHIIYDTSEEKSGKISAANRGRTPWNKGKLLGKQEPWLVAKRTEARRGYRHSGDAIKKIRESHLARNKYLNLNYKSCSMCFLEKNKLEFYKDKRRADGLYAKCKSCWGKYTKIQDLA